MPISSEIQFYVDQELLAIENVPNLSEEQIQILSYKMVKRLITTDGYNIQFFLRDIDPEGKQQISQISSCIEEYINNGLISQEEFDKLDLMQCVKLGQRFIRDLLLNRRITIDQALELDARYATSLDGLDELVTTGKLTRDQILTFTDQQVINIKQICKLIVHDVISIEEALDFTEDQANGLRVIHYLAQLASFPRGPGISIRLDSMLDSWHDLFNGADAAAAIEKVRTFITSNQMDVVFPTPLNTLIFQSFSYRGRSCNLVFNNKLTLQALAALTDEQERRLNYDGVYELLLNDHLTTEQIFALTQGQCYQLDNPIIRAQIIAGELELADIPEPENAFQPPRAINEPVVINRLQSTHTASVHRSVSESAIKLFNRYGSQLHDTNLDELINTIMAWVHALPDGNIIHEAAKRCISRLGLRTYVFTDPGSNVTTRQLIALSWLAIHDENLRHGDLNDAEMQFITGLYEIQREYNLSETGVDLGGADANACCGGTFNKLMEKLINIHPDANIEFITSDMATLKLKVVVKEEIQQYLAARANPLTLNDFLNFTKLLNQLKEDGIEIIWDGIKNNVAIRIFEEFHSLFTNKDDPNFMGLIDGGQYLELDILPSFQKQLLESGGYHQYCSAILKSSGIFSGLIRKNTVSDVIEANNDGKCGNSIPDTNKVSL